MFLELPWPILLHFFMKAETVHGASWPNSFGFPAWVEINADCSWSSLGQASSKVNGTCPWSSLGQIPLRSNLCKTKNPGGSLVLQN